MSKKIRENIDKVIPPKIKINNDGELEITGSFNFELSPTFFNEDFNPVKKISFDWCVELSQAEMNIIGEDKIIELLAEKLKQDFIKLSKQKLK